MRNILACFFLLLSTLSFAQNEFEVITLDSIISTGGLQGVYGLTAETFEGKIHLTYVYGTTDGEWYLMYEVRKDGEEILKEAAYQFAQPVLFSPETAIQFDADGDPHLYCGGVAGGKGFVTIVSRKNGQWDVDPLSFRSRSHVSASKDGSHQLGFATKSDVNPFPIRYFGKEDQVWTEHVFSTGGFYTSEPAAYSLGEEEFMAYLEQRAEDTSVLYIYHRSNQGKWLVDYKETYIQTTPTATSDRWCLFGAHNGTLSLIHTMKSEGKNALLTHMVKEGGGWRTKSSGHVDTYGNNRSNCNTVEFDNDGNFYSVFLHHLVWWANPENESFTFEVPLKGPGYEYYDLAILDKEIYLYCISGNKEFPFGDALVFYEAIGSLEDLTDVDDLKKMKIREAVVAPNPATEKLELQLACEDAQRVHVFWTDVSGRIVSTNKIIFCNKGTNRVELDINGLQSGLYFMKIYNNNGQLTLPVAVK